MQLKRLSYIFYEFYHKGILGKHSVFCLIKDNGIIGITDLIRYLHPSLSRKAMHEIGLFTSGSHKLCIYLESSKIPAALALVSTWAEISLSKNIAVNSPLPRTSVIKEKRAFSTFSRSSR